MRQSNILIAQGGGPTAVINQSMVGIILEAKRHSQITSIYGALHGVTGIINQNFINLTLETDSNLERVALTPCSALGSTRDKPDLSYCREILKVLKAHDIDSFFYIGGNDSSDSLRIIANEAKKSAYPLRCIHIPKTIDNDLMINDHTPGFPSAAKFVANAFSGINQDNRALPGIYVGVVMGRDAGFLTAASTFGKTFEDDGPHLIYLPERDFELNNFLQDIKITYQKFGRCVIAVSEGIRNSQGIPIVTTPGSKLEKDAHGNVQLSGTGALADLLTNYIKTNLNVNRVRGDTFGYLQRSFLGCVSEIDQREAREVGAKAVEFAMSSYSDGSVTINRVNEYNIEYRLNKLEDIAGKTKKMPDFFISRSGNNITEPFRKYLEPLLGKPLPKTSRLEAPIVKKL